MSPQILLHPFILGLGLGLLFAAFAGVSYLRVRWELARFRRHLADRSEIDSDMALALRKELEELRKQNENLRVKNAQASESGNGRLVRDLEIYARAEKRMILSAPGFAPAWEIAKGEAHAELVDEESGRSIPKRVFSMLFGAGKQRLPAPDSGAGSKTGPV